MKKVLLSLAAMATFAAAAPAMAQPYGSDYSRGPDYERGHNGYYGRDADDVSQRIRQISFRIERGQRDGSLNWREARMLRSQVQYLAQRYRYDGLNGWERADLNHRLERLSFQVRGERHDGDYGSGYGRGWGDHDRDGRW